MKPLAIHDWLLLVHAASTLFMVGVIWFVQLVHYPLFARVERAAFTRYELEHTRLTGRLLALPMLAELATVLALVWRLPGALTGSGLALLSIIWVSTWCWQVPAHRRLQAGFDAATHRRLVSTNWVRTVAWSVRGIIALALLMIPR
jgi:hypothetical protein